MPAETLLDPAAVLHRRLRTLVRVRWLGVLFGLLQVATYSTMPYPPGVEALGYVIGAGIGVANVALWLVLHRTVVPWAAVAVTSIVIDALALSAYVWLYSFDPVSGLFALLVLPPIEAALLLGFGVGMWTWVGVGLSYAGREWYAIRYDNPWETSSVTFRVGIVGLVALIVGLMARDLQAQREAAGAALAESQRTDAWRSRLVTMLAHDLRSPLATIRTGLTTLQKQGHLLSPDATQGVLDSSIRQADRLLVMTRDLLDLARAESGRLVLDLQAVELERVVRRAMDLTGLLPEEVDLDIPDDLQVWADPERLEQVLANLLTNARRHGAPPIEVRGASDDGGVVVSVRDHGPGLSAELRDRVFEPYTSSDDSSQSVGLGTWVVARLIEAHGGEVAYEDADPGATFVVRLPTRVTPEGGEPSQTAVASPGPPSR